MNYDMLRATAKLFHTSIDYILYNSDASIPVVESNALNKYKEFLDEEWFQSYCDLYLMMTAEQRKEAINILNEYINEQYEEHKQKEEEKKTKRIRTEKATNERISYIMSLNKNSKRAKSGKGTEASCNYTKTPIALYLRAYGLSIKAVAQEMGVTDATVYTIGVRHQPSVATFERLAAAMTNLGVPKTTVDVMNDLYCAPETLSTD